jgi:hypothetical protein
MSARERMGGEVVQKRANANSGRCARSFLWIRGGCPFPARHDRKAGERLRIRERWIRSFSPTWPEDLWGLG